MFSFFKRKKKEVAATPVEQQAVVKPKTASSKAESILPEIAARRMVVKKKKANSDEIESMVYHEQRHERRGRVAALREKRSLLTEVDDKAGQAADGDIEEANPDKKGLLSDFNARRSLYFGQSFLEAGSVTKQGFGVKVWALPPHSTGDIYEGVWVSNKIKGVGIMRFHNGDTWTGQFQNNQISGMGRYVFGQKGKYSGDVYTGSYYNGVKHGAGMYKFTKMKAWYKGEFARGKYNGWGKFKSAAEEYGGFFDGDEKHGLGVQLWGPHYDDVESQYAGQFKFGKREGLGVLVFKDGTRYLGEFQNGVPHGLGRLELTVEEYVLEGTWENGLKHGAFMIAQSWRPTAEWRTHIFDRDQLVHARAYDFKVDFMNISSKAKAVALKAEEVADKARDALTSSVENVVMRVNELLNIAQRHVESAEQAAKEARILAIQHENYRIGMNIFKDDIRFIRRDGKRLMVHVNDFDPSEAEDAGAAKDLIKNVQAQVAEFRVRLFTSFAQSRPKERKYKEEVQLTLADTSVAANRLHPFVLEELKTDLGKPENAKYSKLRMIDAVVKEFFLSLKELTELLSVCPEAQVRNDILERYFDRLVDYSFPEQCAQLFEDPRWARALLQKGEDNFKHRTEEREKQKKEKGVVKDTTAFSSILDKKTHADDDDDETLTTVGRY